MVALYGQDVTLHCTFNASSPVNLSELSVYWELADTKRSVHSFSAGRDQLTEQADAFANRTSLFNAQLSSGNASLLLRNVRIADDSVFSCFVSLGTFGSGALVLQVAGELGVLVGHSERSVITNTLKWGFMDLQMLK